MQNARVYVGKRHGMPVYLYGEVIDGVFIEEIGGPTKIPLVASVQVKGKDGKWKKFKEDG